MFAYTLILFYFGSMPAPKVWKSNAHTRMHKLCPPDLPWEQALLSLPCPSCQYYSQSIQTAKFKYNMKRGSRRKENKSGIGNRSRALVEGKKRGE